MTPTLADLRRRQLPDLRQGLVVVALLVATFAGVLVVGEALELPSTVGRMSIVNPTLYDVEIDVAASGAEGEAWLSLGGIRRESTKHLYEILDQGSRWVFRFRYGALDVGQMTVGGDQLRAGGWRVSVPLEVGQRLAGAGMRPSA